MMTVRTLFSTIWWILSALLVAFVVRVAVGILDGLSPLSLVATFTFTRLAGTLLCIGAMFLLARFVHRRGLKLYGLVRQGLVRDTLVGFGVGFLLVGIIVSVMSLAGWYRVQSVQLGAILGSLALMLAVGLFEEFIYRGLAFAPLEAKLGTWLALGVSALIFGALHLSNTGATALSTANTVLAGAFFALAFIFYRNLWLPAGIHAGWNFSLLAFGLTVSGNELPTSVTATISGPEVWVGGAYGPEAGLLTTLLLGLVTLTLAYAVVRRKQVVSLASTKADSEIRLPTET